jgi:oxygen-independent coproporphyrinogen-3 oxidase
MQGLRLATGFAPEALREAVALSNGDPIPRGLGLHLHLPHSGGACRACGLQHLQEDAAGQPAADLARLVAQLAQLAPMFDADRELVQLQFTAVLTGTEAPAAAVTLLAAVRAAFRLAAGAEVELRLALPAAALPVEALALGLSQLRDAGFNIIRFAGEDPVACAAALRACAATGLVRCGVDLAYGAAGVDLAAGLASLLAHRPQRIGLFPARHPADLVQLGRCIETLTAAGYAYLGMDQFALRDDPLAVAQRRGRLHANLLGYTVNAESEVLGLGVGALSHVGDCVTLNLRSAGAWRQAVDAGRLPLARGRTLSDEDALNAHLIERLACESAVPVRQLERRFGIDFRRHFGPTLARLAPLLEEGLLLEEAGCLRATRQGRLLLGHIGACFEPK